MLERLSTIESLIQAAKFREAARAVKREEHVLRERPAASTQKEWVKLASYWRRLNNSEKALKILLPLVRGRGRKIAKPEATTLIEYAEVLLNLHLVEEARSILKNPVLNGNHDATIRLGYSYLYTFDYSQAIEILSRVHRDMLDPESYEAAVVQVNLFLARSQLKTAPGFLNEITELIQTFHAKNYHVLVQALVAIGARVSYTQKTNKKQWTQALKRHPGHGFQGQMGRLFEALLLNQKSKLRQLRAEGRKVGAYEMLREIDLQEALLSQNPKLIERVLGQTGQPGYHQHIERLYGISYRPKDFQIGSGSKIVSLKIDERYPPKLARLFQVLVQEQYSPLSLGMIWGRLMSPAHYLGKASQDCIHQWVKRLRAFLIQDAPGLEIMWDQTGYRLKVAGGLKLKIEFPKTWLAQATQDHDLRYLSWLTVVEQCSIINLSELKKKMPAIPPRTHQFFLKKAVDSGMMVRKGSGRTFFYELCTTV